MLFMLRARWYRIGQNVEAVANKSGGETGCHSKPAPTKSLGSEIIKEKTSGLRRALLTQRVMGNRALLINPLKLEKKIKRGLTKDLNLDSSVSNHILNNISATKLLNVGFSSTGTRSEVVHEEVAHEEVA